jgi:hypothetical protein
VWRPPTPLSPVLEPSAMPGMLPKSRDFVPRYQRFESISLQRRVRCEPDFLDQGAELGLQAGARLARPVPPDLVPEFPVGGEKSAWRRNSGGKSLRSALALT